MYTYLVICISLYACAIYTHTYNKVDRTHTYRCIHRHACIQLAIRNILTAAVKPWDFACTDVFSQYRGLRTGDTDALAATVEERSFARVDSFVRR